LSEGRALVSVIIPTFNSERFLEKCLASLKRQAYRKLEMIVVDDGSTDRTVEIAERFECRIIKNLKGGRAEAKNEGVRDSRGEYLFFADSDMEFTSNVIAECVNLIRCDSHIGGIVVPERSVGNSFWVKVRDFERSFYAGSPVESARFFPADVVKKVGGFEENIIFYEESTLPRRIQDKGYDVLARINSVILHHEENFSLCTWLRKKFRYGKTVQMYKRRYGDYFGKQMGFAFRFGLFAGDWTRFWSRPRLAIGVIFLKSQEYLAVVLGSICSKLSNEC
jgi:glycosyltransferase involved in cell wall biosynthesis